MTNEPEQASGEMRVIVITHADAERQPEPKRPLTKLGRDQSQWAANRLKQLIPDLRSAHIVYSPSLRCLETAMLVAIGLEVPALSITRADVLFEGGPEERGRTALQEALALAAGHTNVIVCGHSDMANGFPDQIKAEGLDQKNQKYFQRRPAIVVFHIPRDGNWKIDAVEIPKQDKPKEWQDVKKP